jgi:hypothetical protein
VVAAVPERVSNNYRSSLDLTRDLLNEGKLLVHAQNCPILLYTIRQPLEDIINSPVSKALVWVLTALENSTGSDEPLSEADGMWYATLTRG